MTSVAELIRDRRILVCCGTGGVGKTTTAAVLALEGARQGRRAVVVTIDPAKRLADALGLDQLSNTPSLIEGDWSGELWALMLDTKNTFDSLVEKYSAGPAQAKQILANPFYRNISGALSGTQEYMAGEKLYELHEGGEFDLIVVDTPPSRHALDFLEAPRRLTNFLDHRLYRILMTPTRAYMRAVNVAAQAFLRTVSRVVGSEVVQDAVAFFSAFEGMEQGFRDRAQQVRALLGDERTAYVLVASPRADTIAEATYFSDKLRDLDLSVHALVVNRMHPNFGEGMAEADRERAATLAKAESPEGRRLATLYANLADFRMVASGEEQCLEGLVDQVAPAPVARVPFLSSDVHDLAGLAEVGRHLFPAA